MKSWIPALAITLIALAQLGMTSEEYGRSNGIYKFKHTQSVPTHLVVVNGQVEYNNSPVDLQFTRGEAVAVEFDEDGNALISVKLSPNDRNVPEKIVLNAREFSSAKLKWMKTGTLEALNSSETQPHQWSPRHD